MQPLRDAVAAKMRAWEKVQVRFDLGIANKIELLAAAADLTESRIKLAEAEGDAPAVVSRLEELVKQHQEARDLIAIRVEVGAERQELLDHADARLADAKARLAKADPASLPADAPQPRPKK